MNQRIGIGLKSDNMCQFNLHTHTLCEWACVLCIIFYTLAVLRALRFENMAFSISFNLIFMKTAIHVSSFGPRTNEHYATSTTGTRTSRRWLKFQHPSNVFDSVAYRTHIRNNFVSNGSGGSD